MRPATTAFPPDWAPALAGVAAAGLALGASELLAGVTNTASLVNALGGLAIALEPAGAKDVAVGLFGEGDKAVLAIAVVAGVLAVGGILGALASGRPRMATVGLVAIAGITAAGTARMPATDPGTAAVAPCLACGLAVAAFWWLRRVARPRTAEELHAQPANADLPSGTADAAWARRRFLIASASTLGVAAVAGALGRPLVEAVHPDAVVTSTRLPRGAIRVADPGPGNSIDVPGLTPLVTSPQAMYRVDTALQIPAVDVASWRLEVIGMVDHPLSLTYDELLAMPLHEAYITLACVSNEVGGHLVGSPLWTGVRLKDVLAEAGVHSGATQIVGRSWSDFSAGFPTSWAMAEGREPLIAVGMDRDLLPAAHGFPARLVVPGLYGYVSATKWLTQIELTTREAQDGFWVPLGWAKDGPMLTQSRIDVPSYGAILATGPAIAAGVAWAGDRGVSKVEFRVDGGPWTAATVTTPLAAAAWVQWSADWTAVAGGRTLEVRATDGTGEVQTGAITRPAPDGARGYHRVPVTVA